MSFVNEVVFEDIPLFLEAGGRRADAADADGQTFRHAFESMGWVTVFKCVLMSHHFPKCSCI
jgi:hypothetical protein